MIRSKSIFPFAMLLMLAACERTPATGSAVTAPQAAPAPVVDAELEQLKQLVPADACAWLTPETLKAVYPEQTFELRQKLEPRLSGYAWDSRCTYWAGVGTLEFAKDTPTHTVEIFVATPVSEAKARANLASRRERAQSINGYQSLPELGADAHATTQTGVASLFFVRDGSEVQVNVSDLKTPSDEKIRQALALVRRP